MNIQDMTDAEVYELGLEILLDKLGPTGRLRFLGRCKPHTSDYTAERHEWLDDTPDIKTIVKRVQEKRELKQATLKNEPPKNINDMSDIEVYELGLKAISGKLGTLGIVRFVRLFDTNKDTYSADQCKPYNADERDIVKKKSKNKQK